MTTHGKALYFPYIHFQDENWLKHTLLYWDGVKRIVPSSYSPQDSNSVQSLIAEGLVESVDPYIYTQGAADEFIPTLRHLMKTRGHLGRGAVVAWAGCEFHVGSYGNASPASERFVGNTDEEDVEFHRKYEAERMQFRAEEKPYAVPIGTTC